MRFITTKFHGTLDYLSVVLFMAAPVLFGFRDVRIAPWVPMTIAMLVLVVSLFTNYEKGIVRSIPMPFHLMLDVASGSFMAVSPWLFGFSDEVYLPHLLLGIFAIFAGLTTKTKPAYAENTQTTD